MEALVAILVLAAFISVGALMLKLAVYVFSPNSPNGFWRAVIAFIVLNVGPALAFLFLAKISLWLAVPTVLLGPVVVLRTAYGMSFFRSFIVLLMYLALAFLASALVGGLVPRGGSSVESTAEAERG